MSPAFIPKDHLGVTNFMGFAQKEDTLKGKSSNRRSRKRVLLECWLFTDLDNEVWVL